MSKETLAPSLLLLYGEVENTGYYEKNDHRAKFLWSSPEHKNAFKGITEDKNSFITFANGIVNEMNDKFASVMETLPSIRPHVMRTMSGRCNTLYHFVIL
jgi:ubiquitin conjugation factor E4 B